MGSEKATARAIAGAVAARGTRFAFGVPGGGSNLALVEACEQVGIDFVLCHGETAGVLMAATYAELTGAPGLALATRGPGAMSAVNGVAHALLDRTPVVLVTDAVAHADRERVTHQQVDHSVVFSAAAKASFDIGGPDAAAVAEAAVALALRPPWGPVHLDTVPDPVAQTAPLTAAAQGGPTVPEEWVARLGEAQRPLLLVGVGARGCAEPVRALIEATGIPTLVSYKAKGLVPEDLPSFQGLLAGAAIEHPALEAADVVLAVGLDPVELIPGPWPGTAPVLSVAPWPTSSTCFTPTSELLADPADVLPQLAPLLGDARWDCPGAHLDPRLLPATEGLSPADVVLAVRRAAPRGAVATVDAGAHMLLAMPLWKAYGPGEALISSGLATMGFALPAAIAAALACPDRRIVCFTGDGGLGMCLAELEVLARRDLDVLVVVLNDSRLSLIDVKQEGRRGGAAVSYAATDFAAVASGVGLAACSVSSEDELGAALDHWGRTPGPRLLDARIDPSVYPAVMKLVRGA